MKIKNSRAFTFVEIMVVLALVVLISSIAMVNLLASRRSVEFNVCINNRAVVEHGESSYYIHSKQHTNAISELFDLGYVSKIPTCPSGGVYAWVPEDKEDQAYQTILGCSVHTGISIEENLEVVQETPKEETKAEKKPPKNKKKK